MESSPEGRFLHSGLTFLGRLFIFGGNSHNDTAYSVGTKCFTSDVLIYDIDCETWSTILPPDLPTDLSRYGHSTLFYENSVYIYGGFNGVMLNDLIKYTPASCDVFSFSACLEKSAYGMSCEWNQTSNKCTNMDTTSTTTSISSKGKGFCPKSSKEKNIAICETLKSCSACVQNKFGCVWCGSNCQYSKCRDTGYKVGFFRSKYPNQLVV